MMRVLDRSELNWRTNQQNRDNWDERVGSISSRTRRRKLSRDLDSFAAAVRIDRQWWSALCLDEKSEVEFSYYNTSETINRKEDRRISFENKFWSNREMYIADVVGDNWEPQWFEYISEIFPKDPAVRRELAIQRIFS